MKYPLLFLPEPIRLALEAEYEAPNKPSPPSKPIKRKSEPAGWLFLTLPIMVFMLIFSAWKVLGITIIISIVLVVVSWIFDFFLAEFEFHASQKKFVERNNQHIKEKRQWELDSQSQNSPKNQRLFRQQKLKKILAKTTYPSFINSEVKRGKIEPYFHNFLKTYFQECVFVNVGILQFKHGNGYIPDFTIQESTSSLHIDIEIDEPYSFQNSGPIHFLNADGSHSDEKRNSFFLRHNWIVVRFSEEQVMNQPEDCCLYIQNVLRSLLLGDSSHLSKKTNLKQHNCWSKREAEVLSLKNTRDYLIPLPAEPIGSIVLENSSGLVLKEAPLFPPFQSPIIGDFHSD